MGRSKEEMEGVTLLGNKDVKYSMDYAPEMRVSTWKSSESVFRAIVLGGLPFSSQIR